MSIVDTTHQIGAGRPLLHAPPLVDGAVVVAAAARVLKKLNGRFQICTERDEGRLDERAKDQES